MLKGANETFEIAWAIGMDEHKHIELLTLQAAELTERTPFCPEDQQIAEYFEDELPAAERDHVERHLADCRFCLARLGMLQRLEQNPIALRIPEDVLATAKAMRKPRVRRPKWVQASAAAAALVIAVGVLYQVFPVRETGQVALPRTHMTEPSSDMRETRSADPGAMGPRFLSPREGAGTTSNARVFKWTEVPNSLYYEVRIVSDAGDLLWQERVDGTEWRLPAGLALTSGLDYFVRVDAYLTDAKTLQSGYLLFRPGERG
jgi:hypothetical protein